MCVLVVAQRAWQRRVHKEPRTLVWTMETSVVGTIQSAQNLVPFYTTTFYS